MTLGEVKFWGKTSIEGHVTNGLGICGFLFVINDHESILHGYTNV